jgi:hypothetical protein
MDKSSEIIQLLTEIRDLLRSEARTLEDRVLKGRPRAQRQTTVQDTHAGFNAFWALYPKKVGRGAAEMEWNKIKPDDWLRAEIMRKVEIQCKSEKWREDGGRFIPNPSTWLHQKRWMDEVKTVVVPVQPKAMQQVKAQAPGVPPPPDVAEKLSRLLGSQWGRM